MFSINVYSINRSEWMGCSNNPLKIEFWLIHTIWNEHFDHNIHADEMLCLNLLCVLIFESVNLSISQRVDCNPFKWSNFLNCYATHIRKKERRCDVMCVSHFPLLFSLVLTQSKRCDRNVVISLHLMFHIDFFLPFFILFPVFSWSHSFIRLLFGSFDLATTFHSSKFNFLYFLIT